MDFKITFLAQILLETGSILEYYLDVLACHEELLKNTGMFLALFTSCVGSIGIRRWEFIFCRNAFFVFTTIASTLVIVLNVSF